METISPRSVFIHLWIVSFFYQIAIGKTLLYISPSDKEFLMLIPYYALAEEAIFRHIVFFLFILPHFNNLFYTDKRKFYLRSSIWILISSIIFGYLHGGPINILVQGVGGVFLFIIFLRYFIYYHEKFMLTGKGFYKSLYMPIIMATIFHSLYNYSVMMIGIFG